MAKRALVILADGAEEMEVVISSDILVRGQVDVTIAGLIGPGSVCCSRNVLIQPHRSLEDALNDGEYDLVLLPGGMGGAKALGESDLVKAVLQKHQEAGKLIAAICAGPTVLRAHNIAMGKKVTSHPGVKAAMEESYTYLEDRVVVDGNIVTSRGPGTAFEFALKLVEMLVGANVVKSIVPPLVLGA